MTRKRKIVELIKLAEELFMQIERNDRGLMTLSFSEGDKHNVDEAIKPGERRG